MDIREFKTYMLNDFQHDVINKLYCNNPLYAAYIKDYWGFMRGQFGLQFGLFYEKNYHLIGLFRPSAHIQNTQETTTKNVRILLLGHLVKFRLSLRSSQVLV